MKKSLSILLFTAPMLLTMPLAADNVTDPIQTALKAYEDKEYKLAIEELKYATAALQKLDAEENRKLLPDPLDGWEKKVGDESGQAAMNMFGGGSMTTAEYTRGDEHIEVQIIANSPMIATVAMMINNPMFSGAEGGEPYRYQKLKGIKQKNGDTTEITLLMAGQIMIKLTGKNLKEERLLEQYLDKMELQKIQSKLLQ
ncbi:MAG: hypothetical protein JW682_03665 [Campylobacterales bacterium]|nr:hypothetical protein [Campylobacterales bacterium]HEO98340.1 hypothetical protein [Campylobacterota bacterium]